MHDFKSESDVEDIHVNEYIMIWHELTPKQEKDDFQPQASP